MLQACWQSTYRSASLQEETWVTCYGFQPSELHVVLREFSKCGDIAHFGSGRQDAVNWVHLHYAVRPA